MSSIGSLGDPTWVAQYAAGNLGFADDAVAASAEQETLGALLAPQAPASSPFFAPAPTPSLDPSTTAGATSALAAAEAASPALADEVELLSGESRELDVLA